MKPNLKPEKKMKLKQLIVTATMVFVLAGCSPKEPTETGNEPGVPAATNQNEEASGADSANPSTDFMARQREQFIASGQKTLSELDAGISNLTQKVETYTGVARTNADQTLAGLRAQRDKVQEHFAKLKSASAAAWKEASNGFTSAVTDLKSAFNDAMVKFRQYDSGSTNSHAQMLSPTNGN